MTVLTETELERQAMVLAHKLRICEIEGELRSAAQSLSRAERTMREVLQGAGASLQETLRAGVAIAETRGILQRALERPTPERCTMHTYRGGPRCLNPALPGSSLCAGPHKPEGATASECPAADASTEARLEQPAGAPSGARILHFPRRDLLVVPEGREP